MGEEYAAEDLHYRVGQSLSVQTFEAQATGQALGRCRPFVACAKGMKIGEAKMPLRFDQILDKSVLDYEWTEEDTKEGVRVQIPCAWYITFFSKEDMLEFVRQADETSIADLGGENDEVCYIGWQDQDGFRLGGFA